MRTRFRRLAVILGLFALRLCIPTLATAQAPTLVSTYVLLGEDGRPVVRAVVEGETCPTLHLDGRRVAMARRAGPGTLPVRPTASGPQESKAAAFPVSVCEAFIHKGAQRGYIEDRELPLPKTQIRRIVVIGDTGCRVKSSDRAFQACNVSAQYPFAKVAAAAAAWKPDLVLHVGDFLYRETACPSGAAGCSGSPWGYGWDAWKADWFDPAEPLMRAAPMALARGNHETCARAGQGWWRLLSPLRLKAGRDCIDPEFDGDGDYSPPYAVPLGGHAQLIMFDSANTSVKPLEETDPRAIAYAADYDEIATLAARERHSLLVNHHPLLAFAAKTGPQGAVELAPGNQGLQSVFLRKSPQLLPPGVDVLLSGHIHVWEQLSFNGLYPSQFVAGFSGTQEDIVPLPEIIPKGETPAPGVVATAFSSWVDGFGYMTMERLGEDRWRVLIHDTAGKVVNTCSIVGKQSQCAVAQVHAAP